MRELLFLVLCHDIFANLYFLGGHGSGVCIEIMRIDFSTNADVPAGRSLPARYRSP